MLQSIRDRTQGWIAGIIISLLILSFALWGIHSYFGGSAGNGAIAKVNGVEISRSQLSAAYERMRRQLQTQFGTVQIPSQLESAVKQKALQALINVEVMKQASFSQGYRVSTEQVDSFLANMPEFQVNGQFSATRFRQMLENAAYNPADFLELIRSSLLIDQPRLGIILTSFALPDEVASTISLINQEREIRFALIPAQVVSQKPIQISEEKIKAYYDAHQAEFKTPEKVSIEYIQLSLKDLMATIHPTDDVLKKFYADNSSSYNQPFEKVKEKVKESYIRQQTAETFANMREKLASLTYEHPESLAAAAKELNLKVQTSDVFTKEQGKGIASNPRVRDAAFSNDVLMLQNNSDIIQLNPDDAVVIRVKTHTPAAELSLDAVKNQITEKLKATELNSRAEQLAQEVASKLTADANIDQVSQTNHLTWTKLGFVKRHAAKTDPAIVNKAFAMPKPTKGPSYSVAKSANGYAVVAVFGVREGTLAKNDNQYSVFVEQVQNAEGLAEYELYKQSLVNRAKISVDN